MDSKPTGFAQDLDRWSERVAAIDVESGAALTYAELADRADRFVEQLGSVRGAVFLQVENTLDSLVSYLGCLRGGFPVYMWSDKDLAHVQRLRELFRPCAVVRTSAGVDIELLPDAAPVHPELAVLLSTSGSTGSPKLVRLSMQNIDANAKAIAEYLELDADERPLTALKPHYSYGMSVWNSHLASGGCVLLTRRSVTDSEFWDELRTHEATSFAGVPFTFESILQRGISLPDFPSLRYVTQAGGKLSPELVSRFASELSQADKRFYVMYGQTEAAPRISWLPPEQALTHPDCIGVPIPGGTIELRGDAGAVTTPGEIGTLVYRGPNVMMGYAQSGDDLAGASELDELVTGDLASINDAGLFYIVGRAKRFVKPFGVRVNLDEVQVQIQQIAAGSVCSGDDERIVVAVPGGADITGLGERLAESYNLPAFIFKVHPVDEVPQLSNGKPNYRAILELDGSAEDTRAGWRGLASKWWTEMGRLLGFEEQRWECIQDLYSVLIGPPITEDNTFAEVGDSLTYVQVRLALADIFGTIPEGWETMTVRELEAARNGLAL